MKSLIGVLEFLLEVRDEIYAKQESDKCFNLYLSHMGGYYLDSYDDIDDDWDIHYCTVCGDFDELLDSGTVDNMILGNLMKLIKQYNNLFGTGIGEVLADVIDYRELIQSFVDVDEDEDMGQCVGECPKWYSYNTFKDIVSDTSVTPACKACYLYEVFEKVFTQ